MDHLHDALPDADIKTLRDLEDVFRLVGLGHCADMIELVWFVRD